MKLRSESQQVGEEAIKALGRETWPMLLWNRRPTENRRFNINRRLVCSNHLMMAERRLDESAQSLSGFPEYGGTQIPYPS